MKKRFTKCVKCGKHINISYAGIHVFYYSSYIDPNTGKRVYICEECDK